MVDEETLIKIYNNLMVPAFPIDERTHEDYFIDYFLVNEYKNYHHIEHGDMDWAMVWCDFGDECDIKVIELFTVAENKRNTGIGSAVFRSWLERNNNPKVFIEIDNVAALRFWKRLGFWEVNGLKYSQPALGDDLKPVDNLIPAVNFSSTLNDVANVVRLYWGRHGFEIKFDNMV